MITSRLYLHSTSDTQRWGLALTYDIWLPSSPHIYRSLHVSACVYRGWFCYFWLFSGVILPAQKPKEEILKHYHLEISYNWCPKKKSSTLLEGQSWPSTSDSPIVTCDCHSLQRSPETEVTWLIWLNWAAPNFLSSLREQTFHQYKSLSLKEGSSFKSFVKRTGVSRGKPLFLYLKFREINMLALSFSWG